jgi:hypothetical protein
MLEWARSTWSKVIGQHEVGKMNQNGLSLLSLCAEQQLVITSTILQMKNRLKTTWQHPRSKRWHILDYVIVRQKDRKGVLTTHVTHGGGRKWYSGPLGQRSALGSGCWWNLFEGG